MSQAPQQALLVKMQREIIYVYTHTHTCALSRQQPRLAGDVQWWVPT